ncbi:MAG: glycogen debranching protein, partial [Hymenobacter sp.]
MLLLPGGLLLGGLLLGACQQRTSTATGADAKAAVWQSEAYTLYPDRVVQQKYSARALSPKEIVSDYSSPANEFKSAAISFKFSINGKDNEMVSGTDHHFVCETNTLHSETPLIAFGKQLKAMPTGAEAFLKPGARLKIKLDMRGVLKEFQTKGYYTTFDGNRLYKEDFKGVYVAGSSAPLIWDFDNLVNHPDLKLQDDNNDGIYEIVLALNVKEDEKKTLSRWVQEKDLSAFPTYQSTYPLSDALYNMAMEEMVRAVEPDSTFRTGKEWAGVWTRDVSYSIILSMAHLQPEVAKNSLLRKVNKKRRIIQDTGTGGAW